VLIFLIERFICPGCISCGLITTNVGAKYLLEYVKSVLESIGLRFAMDDLVVEVVKQV
jgi:hypothetical protein